MMTRMEKDTSFPEYAPIEKSSISGEDYEELKANWMADPCWDIETTEGFEAYHDELLAFRHEMEAKWTAEWTAQLNRKAEELGVPGNHKLAEYVIRLERRLNSISEKLDKLYYSE